MKRKFLVGLGISEADADKIMEEYGKSIQAEQAKKVGKTDEEVKEEVEATKTALDAKHKISIDNLNKTIDTLTTQRDDYKKLVDEAPDLNDAVKEATKKMDADHKIALAEQKKTIERQVADLQRDSETVDFLRSLDKKFITPETETAFRAKLNEAVQDKSNEGKSRTDIFKTLILGADGKERTDIFAQASSQPNGAGRQMPPPIHVEAGSLSEALSNHYGGN